MQVTLTIDRADAEMVLRSLEHRHERLCDIRRQLCEPDPQDELEREEAAFFQEEDAAVARAISALRTLLAVRPAE
jgi:hypothetical protein